MGTEIGVVAVAGAFASVCVAAVFEVLVVKLFGEGSIGCLAGRGCFRGFPNIFRYLSMLGGLYVGSSRGGGGLGGSRCCVDCCVVEMLRPVFIAFF